VAQLLRSFSRFTLIVSMAEMPNISIGLKVVGASEFK